MNQITIQAVTNGYVIFPSNLYGRDKDYFFLSDQTYVFHTIGEIAVWMNENFLPSGERKKDA
jgi:hypothetical protein